MSDYCLIIAGIKIVYTFAEPKHTTMTHKNKIRFVKALVLIGCLIALMFFLPVIVNLSILLLIFAGGCYEIATSKLNDHADI